MKDAISETPTESWSGKAQEWFREQFGLEPSAFCAQCHSQGVDVMMREDVVYDYRIYENVDAWVCPECGHSVVREDEF